MERCTVDTNRDKRMDTVEELKEMTKHCLEDFQITGYSVRALADVCIEIEALLAVQEADIDAAVLAADVGRSPMDMNALLEWFG